MKEITFREIAVIGFALFALFFGAGNLIFPPYLGYTAGRGVLIATSGFLLTGVGLPLLGIVAVAKAGGNIEKLSEKVHPVFSKIFATIVVLAIGPLVAIPRTSATTYEMGILPNIPSLGSIPFSFIYFAVVLFFVLRPSNVVDSIGKILTPLLFATLIIIIGKGFLTPIGPMVKTGLALPFPRGFVEGYQTMDAIGATVFGTIIISFIKSKGIHDIRQQTRLTFQAGLISALGLGIIYTGLGYLGATASGAFPADLTRAQILIAITEALLGTTGRILLGFGVGLACLTTSIGLTATTGKYFSRLTKGKVSYKLVCILTAGVSLIIANAGVQRITSLALPLLVILYPIIVVLVILSLFDQYLPNKNIYKGAVIGTFLASSIDALSYLNVDFFGIENFAEFLPLHRFSLGWIVPAFVGGILAAFIVHKKPQKPTVEPSPLTTAIIDSLDYENDTLLERIVKKMMR